MMSFIAFLVENLLSQGFPTPFPTVGKGSTSTCTFVSSGESDVPNVFGTPEFGRFWLAQSVVAKTSLTGRSRDQLVHTRAG